MLKRIATLIRGNAVAIVPSEDFSQTIIDFLYVDDQKIRLLADQILGDQAIDSKSKQSTTSGTRAFAMKAGIKELGGHISGEKGHSVTEVVTQNTYWKNARALIEVVRESETKNLVSGSLCHLSGTLTMCDLAFARDLDIKSTDVEPVIRLLEALGFKFHDFAIKLSSGNTKNFNGTELKNATTALVSILVQIARCWPSRVVGNFNFNGQNFWFTLNEDNIQQEYRDSLLRYRGVSVPGIWHMVSIVDAVPSTPLIEQYGMLRPASASGNDGMQHLISEFYKLGGMLLGMEPHMFSAMPVILYRHLDF